MQDRFLIYIDILGFSNYVKSSPNEQELLETYNKIFELLQGKESCTPYEIAGASSNQSNFIITPEITMISDSILISFQENNPDPLVNASPEKFREGVKKRGYMDFYSFCLGIPEAILKEMGLLVRGVVHFGKLHHEGHKILGKGFIEAYDYEKNFKNPVIYLSREFYKKYQLLPAKAGSLVNACKAD